MDLPKSRKIFHLGNHHNNTHLNSKIKTYVYADKTYV